MCVYACILCVYFVIICRGSGSYIEWNVCLSSVNKAASIASIASHGSMYSTLSKQSAINIVWGITWNSSDHISWICQKNNIIVSVIYSNTVLNDVEILWLKALPIYLRFMVILCSFEKWSCRKKMKKRKVTANNDLISALYGQWDSNIYVVEEWDSHPRDFGSYYNSHFVQHDLN